MSEEKAHPRPRQVTVAGVLAVVAATMLVAALFDAMTQVRSADTRDAVSAFLHRPPGDGLGIGVEQTLRILRGMVLFNGALAAACAVLAVYVLLGNRGARIALSIAAAVLLFTAPFSGGVLPIVLAAAAAMLWSAPARDWFAGRPPRPVPARAEPGPREEARPGPSSGSSGGPTSGWATPHAPVPSEGTPEGRPAPSPYPFGGPAQHGEPAGPPAGQPPAQPYGQPYGQPAPYAQPTAQGGWPAPAQGPGDPWSYSSQPQGRGARPGSVAAAAWLTWIFSGLTVLLYGGMLAMLAGVRDQLLSAVQQDNSVSRLNMSGDDLVRVLWVAGVVIVFWCVSAIVLAALAFRGHNWARILLAVSAAFAALFSIAAFPVGLLVTVAAGITVAMLLVPASNDWFAGRPSRTAPQYYTPYGHPPSSGAPFGPPPPYPGTPDADAPAAPAGEPVTPAATTPPPPAPAPPQGGSPGQHDKDGDGDGDGNRDRDERDNVW